MNSTYYLIKDKMGGGGINLLVLDLNAHSDLQET